MTNVDKVSSRALAHATFLALALLLPSALLGQGIGSQGADDDASGIRFDVRAGVVDFATGAGSQCNSESRGLALGAEASTRGRWLVSASADLNTGGLICTAVGLPQFEFDGRQVREHNRDWGVGIEPRFALHGGYRFDLPFLGGIALEPKVGAGLITSWSYFGEGAVTLRPWYGSTVSLRSHASRFGLQFELGQSRLPTRYCDAELGCGGPGNVVAEFSEWDHFARFMVTFALNPLG